MNKLITNLIVQTIFFLASTKRLSCHLCVYIYIQAKAKMKNYVIKTEQQTHRPISETINFYNFSPPRNTARIIVVQARLSFDNYFYIIQLLFKNYAKPTRARYLNTLWKCVYLYRNYVRFFFFFFFLSIVKRQTVGSAAV